MNWGAIDYPLTCLVHGLSDHLPMNFNVVAFSVFVSLLLQRQRFYFYIVQRYTIQDLLFSSLAKDLIRGLLRTDPQNRFTVEQVINNPWIKVNTLDSIVLYTSILKLYWLFPSNIKYTVRSVFVPAQKTLTHACRRLDETDRYHLPFFAHGSRRPWDIVARNSYCKNLKTNGPFC